MGGVGKAVTSISALVSYTSYGKLINVSKPAQLETFMKRVTMKFEKHKRCTGNRSEKIKKYASIFDNFKMKATMKSIK